VETRFGLGYSDGNLSQVVTRDEKAALVEVGLLKASGREHFEGCIVVPLLGSEEEEVVGFYGRRIEEKEPRHLYLPGTHQGLVNGRVAKAYADGLVLAESVIDALSLVALSVEGVIPCYGTGGFTEAHRAALREAGTRRVLVAFDADSAGREGSSKLVASLAAEGILAGSFELEGPSKDWNEYLVQGGSPEALREKLDAAFGALSEAKDEGATKEGQETSEASGSSRPVSVEREGRRYLFRFSGASYRVQGAEGRAAASMRVSVRAEAGDEPFLDSCDLYSSRSRASFASAFARASGREEARVTRELLMMAERIDSDRESLSGEGRVEVPEPTEAERAEALRFLRSNDILDRVTRDMDALGYVGERENKLLAYLCGVSRLLSKPLSVYIQAGSSSGKSFLLETLRRVLPPESVLALSSFSDQALNYLSPEDLEGKVMLLGEAIHNELVEGQIRQMQSEGELSRLVVVKDPRSGELASRQVRHKVRLSFMMSSTALYLNAENASRCLVLHTDESRAQTERVLALQRSRRTAAGLAASLAEGPRIEARHRVAGRMLEALPVFNPLAPFLSFPTSRPSMRRAQEQFLSLLETLALLKQHLKKRVAHVLPRGEIEGIEVELSDYAEARELFTRGVLAPNAQELPVGARLLFEAALALVEKKAREDELPMREVSFIQRDLREASELGADSIKRYLRMLVDFEYLELASGRRHGTRFSYRIREADSPAPLSGLPEPESLACLLETGALGKTGEFPSLAR
jgi:hypothetical protein